MFFLIIVLHETIFKNRSFEVDGGSAWYMIFMLHMESPFPYNLKAK